MSSNNNNQSSSNNRRPVDSKSSGNLYATSGARSGSNSRIQGPTAKIAKRQLWWKEVPSEKMIPPSKPFKPVVDVTPRIDNDNQKFRPAAYNGKQISTQKLNWQGNAVVDSWSNAKHQPGGGNKEIIDDNVHYNALPKVDCGFQYEFQE